MDVEPAGQASGGGVGVLARPVAPKPGGETTVDLGVPAAGDIGYSCGTAMYGGVIEVVDG